MSSSLAVIPIGTRRQLEARLKELHNGIQTNQIEAGRVISGLRFSFQKHTRSINRYTEGTHTLCLAAKKHRDALESGEAELRAEPGKFIYIKNLEAGA